MYMYMFYQQYITRWYMSISTLNACLYRLCTCTCEYHNVCTCTYMYIVVYCSCTGRKPYMVFKRTFSWIPN